MLNMQEWCERAQFSVKVRWHNQDQLHSCSRVMFGHDAGFIILPDQQSRNIQKCRLFLPLARLVLTVHTDHQCKLSNEWLH